MKLFPPDPEITIYEDGFESADLLNRKSTGKNLSDLVENIEDPVVIALDGAWGTGKSYFLKRWVGAHGSENGGTAITVYFDAFAHDFLEDPLIALTGVIGERLPVGKSTQTWKRFKSAAIKLAKPVTRVGLAVATYGASEVTGAIADVAIAASSKELERVAEDFWKREDGRREAMRQVREALIALTTHKDGSRPLVVVVDELDRCRPDYALGLLEIIKHFFSVPNVHFVLGVNLKALQNCVKARYGSGIDAEEYLRRFVSVTLRLPDYIGSDEQRTVQIEYFNKLSAEMGVPREIHDTFENHLKLRLRVNKISIRDLGRILTHIVLLPKKDGFPKMFWGWQEMIASMLLFKVLEPNLYDRVIGGSAELHEVRTFYGIRSEHITGGDDRSEKYDHISYMTSGLWEYVLSGGVAPQDRTSQFAEAFDRFGGAHSQAELPRKIARDFVETFSLGPIR